MYHMFIFFFLIKYCVIRDTVQYMTTALIILIKSQVIIKGLLFCHRDITSSIVVMEAVV